MKYARQTQEALDRLDGALAQLRQLILRSQNKEAVKYDKIVALLIEGIKEQKLELEESNEEEINFSDLEILLEELNKNYKDDWLAKLEIYELTHKCNYQWVQNLGQFMKSEAKTKTDLGSAIHKSLQLIEL